MPKILILFLSILSASLVSCVSFNYNLFPDDIYIDELLSKKELIDQEQNPALQQLMKNDLGEKRINLINILVKDIIKSTNVDYDFCILADLETKKGPIECYIFSKDIYKISKLKKKKSRINTRGSLGRFFTMLDKYYTKIELNNAKIAIRENKKKGDK